MKLHFALRQLGIVDNSGNIDFFKNKYFKFASFPIRSSQESDTYWDNIKDCIGFTSYRPKNSKYWVPYKLKKL